MSRQGQREERTAVRAGSAGYRSEDVRRSSAHAAGSGSGGRLERGAAARLRGEGGEQWDAARRTAAAVGQAAGGALRVLAVGLPIQQSRCPERRPWALIKSCCRTWASIRFSPGCLSWSVLCVRPGRPGAALGVGPVLGPVSPGCPSLPIFET